MAKLDANEIKLSTDIVAVIEQFITGGLEKQGGGWKGLCPFHAEKTGSFNVNPDLQSYKCFGCGEGGDVIDFIQKHKGIEFNEALEYLAGAPKSDPKTKKKKSKDKTPSIYVPLDYESAKKVYTKERMQEIGDFIFKANPKKFVKAWPYKNANGDVELVVARFEDESGKKATIPYHYTGKTLKSTNGPVLLFGRDRLQSDPTGDVLLVGGEKCATAAESLGYIGVTGNGGDEQIKSVDLSPLNNRNIFIWPDDDKPGRKWREFLIRSFPQAKIVPHIAIVQDKIKTGSDIADAIEIIGIEETKRHIRENSRNPSEIQPKELLPDPTAWPFKILGVADDGRAYFISETDRLQAYNLSSITRTQLINLVGVEWWRTSYGDSRKEWEEAQSDIITLSSVADFDPERMRGRGAWREPDGAICYHNGKKLIGEYSESRIYLRRTVQDIGLGSEHASASARENIFIAASDLTFSSFADCVRTLCWSILAPFAGALPWRPSGLMTAESGAGKTTIVNSIIKPLCMPIICSGGESTSAGIRQRIAVDSCAVVVEEAEADTQKKKQNRDETFSLMRQSTSDDSPDVLKGTIDGKGMKFTLRSMFFFVAISPEIGSEADENRIFRVNLSKASYSRADWLKREKFLKTAITPDICASVRSFTWSNLKNIISLSERIASHAQHMAGIDNRTSFAESLLLAAFMVVFQNKRDPPDDDIVALVNDFYSSSPREETLNETELLLENYLDHVVREGQYTWSIRNLLEIVATGSIDGVVMEPKSLYRRLAGHKGIGIDPDGNYAIAKNHPEAMKILDRGKGYHHQFTRHPLFLDKAKSVGLGGNNTKSCVIIRRV